MEMDDKCRILVVDDEETLCEVLRFNLEEEGYEVDVAFSAEEALSLNLESYSLILLDIMMGSIWPSRHSFMRTFSAASMAMLAVRECHGAYPDNILHGKGCGRGYDRRA